MGLIINYGLNTTVGTNFTIDFSIPDNCRYEYELDGGTYLITVQLKKGYTEPSSIYVPCTLTLATPGTDMKVNFKQILEGIATTKPKITIESC